MRLGSGPLVKVWGYRRCVRRAFAAPAFAVAHAAPLGGTGFPRGKGGTNAISVARYDNLGATPSVYANPEKALR